VEFGSICPMSWCSSHHDFAKYLKFRDVSFLYYNPIGTQDYRFDVYAQLLRNDDKFKINKNNPAVSFQVKSGSATIMMSDLATGCNDESLSQKDLLYSSIKAESLLVLEWP